MAHKHRLCLPKTARAEAPYSATQKRAQGWKSDAMPHGWNKRWRANGQYHNKHTQKRRAVT